MLERRALLRRLAGEEGSMLVVAGVLTVAIALLSGVVLQVGDWLQHRRSAQVRADAAAFAGGQLFGQCFDTTKFTAAQASTNMHELAKHYAGYASAVPGTPFNPQFGGGSTTLPLFASKTYSGGGGGGPDDTMTDNECSADNQTLDVKLTDQNIPALMSIFPQAKVHAHARVQMQSIVQFKGAFPLAIPEVEPKYVAATFVDEATGNELTGCGATGLATGTTCTYLLTKGATANNLTSWAVSASPNLPAVASAAAAKQIGVRIGMGGLVASCANTGGTENWACFDANANARGALMIRDYAAGSGGAVQPLAPILRAVSPSNSCAPGFASQFGTTPFVSDAGGIANCSVGVSARIDFGTGANNPTLAAPAGVKAIVHATINGATITLSPVPLSYNPASTTWLWTPSAGSATVPVNDAGAVSAYPVTISWEEQAGTQGGKTCTTGGGNKCTGTFASAARFTSATSDDEGPIKLMSVTQGGVAAYSLTPGVKTVDLQIRIQGSLGVINPPVLQALRLTHTTNSSRTTAVACDGPGDADFVAAVRYGCKTPYQINVPQICPDPAPPAGPADCVPTKTGNLGNSVVKALDDRFAGCPVNNWPDYTKTGDPRVIVMMLTDFSAYSGQGKTRVPVVNFAAFYVIGWTGNKCGAAWPFPGSEPNGGNIWGYFVKYASLTQIPNGLICDPNQITPCVPVLVR